MALKGLIFDLDGVIVDTVPLHYAAWKRMFAEYDKEFTFEDYKEKVDGIPRTDGARAILTNLPDKELEAAATRKQGYFVEALKREAIKIYQGTFDLVEEAIAAGVKRAVISSSKNCRDILVRIGKIKLFDVVLTGHDVKSGKPDPQIFLLACKKLGLKPAECVVFEDAVLGVEAGIRGGMKTVGIDRYDHPERLIKADLVVSDLSEVNLAKIKALMKT